MSADPLSDRARRLRADPRLAPGGLGSVSAKLVVEDPVDGGLVRVLRVGPVGAERLAALELDALLALEPRLRGVGAARRAALVARCAFDDGLEPPGADVLLHAFLPCSHVDHVCPDAVLALACAANGAALVREVYGRDVAWLDAPDSDPERALAARELVEKAPEVIGLVLAGRGLVVFGESSDGCFRNTVELVERALAWFEPRVSDARAFGALGTPLARPEREARAAELLPVLRGRLSTGARVVARFDDSPAALAFVGSEELEAFAARAARHGPLVLAPGADLDAALARHRARHGADPRVVLSPGLGIAAFAPDATAARVAAERFASAIAILRGAEAVDRCVTLPEWEPPAAAPGGARVAWVSGGASALGRASAARLLADGACVALADLDVDALEGARAELGARSGADRVVALRTDPADDASVARSFQRAVLAFGGIDVVVWHARAAASAAAAEAPLERWRRSHDALADGALRVAREALRVLERQALGGAVVLVTSPSARGAALELARSLADEGAPHGIRANAVSADGAPEDVAEAVAFLSSEHSRGSTGNVLGVAAPAALKGRPGTA